MPIGRQVKIVSITGSSSSGSATDIASGHAWIVAIVGPSEGTTYCRLPSGAEVGDVVEVYTDGSQFTHILAPANESYLPNDSPSIGGSAGFGGVFCRKISADTWVWIH